MIYAAFQWWFTVCSSDVAQTWKSANDFADALHAKRSCRCPVTYVITERGFYSNCLPVNILHRKSVGKFVKTCGIGANELCPGHIPLGHVHPAWCDVCFHFHVPAESISTHLVEFIHLTDDGCQGSGRLALCPFCRGPLCSSKGLIA